MCRCCIPPASQLGPAVVVFLEQGVLLPDVTAMRRRGRVSLRVAYHTETDASPGREVAAGSLHAYAVVFLRMDDHATAHDGDGAVQEDDLVGTLRIKPCTRGVDDHVAHVTHLASFRGVLAGGRRIAAVDFIEGVVVRASAGALLGVCEVSEIMNMDAVQT